MRILLSALGCVKRGLFTAMPMITVCFLHVIVHVERFRYKLQVSAGLASSPHDDTVRRDRLIERVACIVEMQVVDLE